MICPNCNETLVMSERQGVEIDYCPKCRGVWLDKGELDKIIERSAENETRSQQYEKPDDRYRDDDRYREENRLRDDEYYKKHGKYPQRKKRGFLGDFFDFD
jgi:Zn-finger nucleic acid-binding protein